MKKLIALCVISLFCVVSCKPKMDLKAQTGIRGTWTLTNVKHIGGEFVKINSFNIADSECLIGSQWKFVSNNNSGSVVLTSTAAECPEFDAKFKWTVSPSGEFKFKFLEEGVRAKKVNVGYSLQVANQSDVSFQLVDKFFIGSKAENVIYQFEKTK